MSVKEKLVELLGADTCKHDCCEDCEYCEDRDACIDYLKNSMADHLIAHGVTVQEWISVKDRLPEEPDRYLCNVKSFVFKGAYYQTILKYDKGGFIEGHIYTDDVTHWMPLPQPPKGE